MAIDLVMWLRELVKKKEKNRDEESGAPPKSFYSGSSSTFSQPTPLSALPSPTIAAAASIPPIPPKIGSFEERSFDTPSPLCTTPTSPLSSRIRSSSAPPLSNPSTIRPPSPVRADASFSGPLPPLYPPELRDAVLYWRTNCGIIPTACSNVILTRLLEIYDSVTPLTEEEQRLLLEIINYRRTMNQAANMAAVLVDAPGLLPKIEDWDDTKWIPVNKFRDEANRQLFSFLAKRTDTLFYKFPQLQNIFDSAVAPRELVASQYRYAKARFYIFAVVEACEFGVEEAVRRICEW